MVTPAMAGREHWVDIGGRHLALLTGGTGSPTVVCESGGGSTRANWAPVWSELCGLSHCCCYDRGGLGRSEGGPQPRGSLQVAEELCRALDAAAIPGPYLLVGHSLGGHHIRVFAARYPERVAGLVLVDPSVEGVTDYLRARVPAEALERMLAEERAADQDSDLPPALFAELSYANQDLCAEQVRAAPIPDSLPLVVLTAAVFPAIPDFPVDLRAMTWDLHEAIARTSRLGRHRWIERSSHSMVRERPDAVVAAVRELLGETRGGAPGR